MKISRASFINLIKEQTKPTFINIFTNTAPAMTKTDNPFFGNVRKKAQINCQINFNYENGVNRVRIQESKKPNFKAGPRQWGDRENSIVTNGDNQYLHVRVLSYVSVAFFLKGNKVSRSSFNEISSFFAKKHNYSAQSVLPEHEVIIRDFDFNSIEAVKMNKILYELVE